MITLSGSMYVVCSSPASTSKTRSVFLIVASYAVARYFHKHRSLVGQTPGSNLCMHHTLPAIGSIETLLSVEAPTKPDQKSLAGTKDGLRHVW